jgi:hypothetical protein
MVDIILCYVMAKLGVKTVNEVGAVAIRGGGDGGCSVGAIVD